MGMERVSPAAGDENAGDYRDQLELIGVGSDESDWIGGGVGDCRAWADDTADGAWDRTAVATNASRKKRAIFFMVGRD